MKNYKMVKTGSKGDVKQTQDKWKDADWARLLQRNEIQFRNNMLHAINIMFFKNNY